jgi:hypothetical protein
MSPLFESAVVLVRFGEIAVEIVNTNDGVAERLKCIA